MSTPDEIAPDTTLSGEHVGDYLEVLRERDDTVSEWAANTIRDLDANLVDALQRAVRAEQAEKDGRSEREFATSRIFVECERVERAEAKIADLTERLRVAEDHAAAIEDRINALKPFVVHKDGAHKVLLHNFDVMVAFFGDKDQAHRWDDLRAILAPTSDAARKEATDAS